MGEWSSDDSELEEEDAGGEQPPPPVKSPQVRVSVITLIFLKLCIRENVLVLEGGWHTCAAEKSISHGY